MTGTTTPPVITVTISGDIDVATCDAMQVALEAGLGTGPVHLAADLSGVTFMDASGIGVLLAVRWLAIQAGGSLTLRAPSRAVTRLVGILGLGKVLPTVLQARDLGTVAVRPRSAAIFAGYLPGCGATCPRLERRQPGDPARGPAQEPGK